MRSFFALALISLATPATQEPDSARSLVETFQGNLHERAIRIDPRTGASHRLPANALGKEPKWSVFDNTCPTGYYARLQTATQNGAGSTGPMALGDWGLVPSSSYLGSETCSPNQVADTFDVTQFSIAYCTSDGGPIDLVLHFWDRDALGGFGLGACDGTQLIGGSVPPAVGSAADFTLTGLPRSSAALATGAACYAIQIDIGTPGFFLDGGVAGATSLGLTGDRFAWSMQVTNGSGGTGPVLAGNALLGSPCTFCAGTIWELGGHSTNPGIGLGQTDHVFLDTYSGTTPATGNCFSFGGNPWAGAWLMLDASQPTLPFFPFCRAGKSSCPCGNAGDPNSGCDNAQGTGGVEMAVVAVSTSPVNRITLTGTGFPTMGSPTALVIRSNALDPMGAVVFGDGLRCVSASPLVRLGATVAVGGTSVHAFGHDSMAAGTGSFFYQIWYRNTPASFCDPKAAFNLSSGWTVYWP